MNPPNLPSSSPEDEQLASTPPSDQRPVESQETREQPTLTVEVVDTCASEGNYVGLGGKQRKVLGVDLAGVVHLKHDGGDLGLYVVGKGKKALLKSPEKCAANLPEGVSGLVQMQAFTAEDLQESVMSFTVGEVDEESQRHQNRVKTISSRFEGIPEGEYMVIPTALSILMDAPFMNPDRPTLRMIFEGTLEFNGQERKVVFVPAGTEVQLTQAMRDQLGMASPSEISLGMKEGKLVIDQLR